MEKGLSIVKFAAVQIMIVADVTTLVHRSMLSYNKTFADDGLKMLNRKLSYLGFRTGVVFRMLIGMGFPMKKTPYTQIQLFLVAH